MKRLSKQMEKALSLLGGDWTSLRDLQRNHGLTVTTLDGLVTRGLVQRKVEHGAGFPGIRNLRTHYRSTT